MYTTNHTLKENCRFNNYYSHNDWISIPNQICCPYFYYTYMNNHMNYRSFEMNRDYNNSTNTTTGTMEIENHETISPNVYKFKNNFNIYLQKTKFHD